MKIHLYWHTETDDVGLGNAYVDQLPRVDDLITWVPVGADAPSQAGWRVTTVQITPAAEGSFTANALRTGQSAQAGIYHVFVEPAEGPFHAAAGQETQGG